MENDFSHSSSPPLDSRGGRGEFSSGFTLIELLISVFIISLISIAAVVNLSASRRTDQLNNAARLVAADLRSLQSRALSGQNIKSCPDKDSKQVVCENDTSACSNPMTCSPLPPLGVGVHFDVKQGTSYDLFADVDASSKNDWKKTDASEIFQTRDLAANGAPNVTIDDLIVNNASQLSTDVAFQRQNGLMGIDATFDKPMTVRIKLRHLQSNDVKFVSVNSVTGRISIE